MRGRKHNTETKNAHAEEKHAKHVDTDVVTALCALRASHPKMWFPQHGMRRGLVYGALARHLVCRAMCATHPRTRSTRKSRLVVACLDGELHIKSKHSAVRGQDGKDMAQNITL